MTNPKDAIAFFDAIAKRYDRDYALDRAATLERLRPVVAALAAGARVLDLGVGTGRELPALLDAGFAVTGLDASEPMLNECRKRARPIPLVTADFYEPLPFANETFDAVLALHGTLAHPPSREAIAALGREVARVLAPRGWFFVEVPSAEWLAELERQPLVDGVRTATRIATDRTRHEDRPSGASVEALVLDDGEWATLLSDDFEVMVEPFSRLERRVIARRRIALT